MYFYHHRYLSRLQLKAISQMKHVSFSFSPIREKLLLILKPVTYSFSHTTGSNNFLYCTYNIYFFMLFLSSSSWKGKFPSMIWNMQEKKEKNTEEILSQC